ncbi:hypothetical protein [Leptolyngbya ohadii]|uniref:hypothetical protein n=1 Tax=Leptolyngbya ohadii TaxID=1962290 RepID=UPI000B59E38E|nr:hypothetical protein [Leptolyngbya ohadii]
MMQSQNISKGEIRIETSLLQRAVEDDQQALIVMFKQFISEDEQCYFLQYLGIEGFWGFGVRSFGCLTDRRVATIQVGFLGEVTYQDGFLEFINSCVIYQPSKLYLYIYVLLIASLPLWSFLLPTGFPANVVAFLITSALSILLFPLAVRLYYRFFKCGLVFWVREGVPVYIFANRKFLRRANSLFRNSVIAREQRIKQLRN